MCNSKTKMSSKSRATTSLYISDYYYTPHHVTTGTLHLLMTTHLGRLVPRRINHLYVWNKANTWVFYFSSKQLCDCTLNVPYAQMWRVLCFQIPAGKKNKVFRKYLPFSSPCFNHTSTTLFSSCSAQYVIRCEE